MTSNSGNAIRPDYVPHARAERVDRDGPLRTRLLVARGDLPRAVTPARHQSVTYGLLLIYAVYALASTAIAWRARVPSTRWRLLSHALDLVLFSVFVDLTEAPASPFFLYFVFALFCATVRFS